MPNTENVKTAETKTTTVKEEKATTQNPTTGSTTKVETTTTTTTAPTGRPSSAPSASALDARAKKIVNITSFAASAGMLAGLGYAFAKKKGFWAYVGYGLLGSVFIGTAAGLTARAVLKPEEKK
jgi:hypothetical protein